MRPEVRRERIVDRVRERERVSVDELAAWLDSSRETIRRDLTALAAAGRVRKFHGGATLAEVPREDVFARRLVVAVHEKRAVASLAAGSFAAGSTIFVDVGTTTLLFAEALADRRDLTVITNGIEIARRLARTGVKVFVVGGELNLETAAAAGPIAVEQIGRFYASDAVISVAGLSARGAMDFQLDEAQIARAMIAQARALTVIADGSKLDRDALFQVCPLEAIDRLIVDRPPAAPLAALLQSAGVQVLLANLPLALSVNKLTE